MPVNAIDRRKLELENYNPPSTIGMNELERFWTEILAAYAAQPLGISREPHPSPFPSVRIDKLTYKGFDDTPVHGWLMLPESPAGDRLPCIVTYPGYTMDRGMPERYASWLLLGYAVLAVDVRGQGGETGNHLVHSSGASKGWVSQGITDKAHSYYLAITIDAVRAVDAAAEQPEIDAAKIATVGASQGGGLSLLAAALQPKVAAAIGDIPNMCHMDYGILHSTGSLTEIAHYLSRFPDRLRQVLDNLAYFDLLNLVPRITAPVLMSVGWKDTICLPETIYAVYNRIDSRKHINDYPFIGHEVREYQNRESILFLQDVLKPL
jgi:cephalosporin-C deacetylase